MIQPGKVYLVDLGFAGKYRLMVVLSRRDDSAPRALTVCAPITTSRRGGQYEVEVGRVPFLSADSCINVQGIQAVQHHEPKRRNGSLPEAALAATKAALVFMFDLEESDN